MDKYSWFKFVDSGIIFILLTLALSHVTVWAGRFRIRSERGHFYFSLMTLVLAVYSYLHSLWPAEFYRYLKPDNLVEPLVQGMIFFAFFFGFTRFLDGLTGTGKTGKWLIFLTILAALVPLAGAYTFLDYGNYRLRYFFDRNIYLPSTFFAATLNLAGFVPLLVRGIRKRMHRDPLFVLVFGGVLFLIVFLLLKESLSHLKLTRYFYNWQMLFPCIFFSVALTRKFNREFADLQELKSGLERKVEERTREMVAARDEVERMHRQRTDLFMNLAHETRTPLTLIRYHLDRYREGRQTDPDLKMIADNILKLQRDMINFLDSEKIRRGEMLYCHNQRLDLSEFVRTKSRFYTPFARSRGLTLTAEVAEGLTVRADPFALDRVLNNLVMNAIKFTATGEVKIVLTRRDGDPELSVSDTGRGIPPEKLAILFDPLSQAARKKSASQGYGLGLFITRQIIGELGGTLQVKNRNSGGTVFTVRLKALPEGDSAGEETPVVPYLSWLETPIDSLPAAAVANPKAGEDPNGPILLVVEDNTDLLGILTREFSAEYRVLSAINGAEALRILASGPVPDLVLSDLMMDVMDGEELLRILKEDPRYQAVPFVFLSAADGAETRLRTLAGGAVEFVPKPFSVPELKMRVESLIRFSREQKSTAVRGAIDLLTRSLAGEGKTGAAAQQDQLARRCGELGLSERQGEIAALVAQGLEYKEIADRLGISLRTVTRHVQNLYEKLSVHNKVELVNRLKSSGE